MMSKYTWVIAGSTSAIAKAFAHLAASEGHDVILLARDEQKMAHQSADLSIRYQTRVASFIFNAENSADFEGIALSCFNESRYPLRLLFAFGWMPETPSIELSQSQAQITMQTNYNAAALLTLAFLPYLKGIESKLVYLGSVAGDRGRPSNFMYGSAKAALQQFCEGLRASLSSAKISVTLMRLGFIDTPLSYGKPGYFLAASPQACANACMRAANKKRPAPYFPWFWRWIMLLFKWMPRVVFNKLKV
jgi:decaprenylphospho-beta-D-erythro-pentofuranosid-2-ulose 2-reductase